MSRVSYSMMNPGGAALMTAAVREALAAAWAMEVGKTAGISHEDILEATLAGNPIMHHLLLGIDPVELGVLRSHSPLDHSLYAAGPRPSTSSCTETRESTFCRCIAGHVGADAAGMVLAESAGPTRLMTLLVDVAPMPRSCSATATNAGRLFQSHRVLPSRVHRSAAASAPRRERSSGFA